MDALQHWADEKGMKYVVEYEKRNLIGRGPEWTVECMITFIFEGGGRHRTFSGVAGSEEEAMDLCIPSFPPAPTAGDLLTPGPT